jgi:hypothetical protein
MRGCDSTDVHRSPPLETGQRKVEVRQRRRDRDGHDPEDDVPRPDWERTAAALLAERIARDLERHDDGPTPRDVAQRDVKKSDLFDRRRVDAKRGRGVDR